MRLDYSNIQTVRQGDDVRIISAELTDGSLVYDVIVMSDDDVEVTFSATDEQHADRLFEVLQDVCSVNTKASAPAWLCEALNSGDGVYRP